jgi:hypothetical protein
LQALRGLRDEFALDYEQPPNSLPKPLIGLLVAIIVGSGAAVWLRRRRERQTSSETQSAA